jgi:signal recognition particle receptor subunit beta
MVSINYAFKEIISKIVYYGPGLSGKTTNLQYVFKKIPNETRGELISLATDADRTLYFDFLPVNVGTIQGFSTKFQLYTVPGQVYYNATRKLVLRGVDGLVFVADSQVAKMDENIESLQNLRDNLEEYGYDINQIPLVIQYNKRDLPEIASIEELERTLNPRHAPYFEGVAVTGEGVFKTLKAISKIVLDQVRAKKMEPARALKIQPVEVGVATHTQAAPAPKPERPRVPQAPAMAAEVSAPSEGVRAVEVPLEPSRSKSRDRIGTQDVEPAIIKDPDTPGNVVVSDGADEPKPYYEIPEEKDDLEETTERSVLHNDFHETGTKKSPDLENLPLTNEYSEVEEKPVRKKKSFVLDSDYDPSRSDDTVLVPEIDLRSPMALGRPQMAESRKVKGKKRRGFFGLFKGSNK